MATLTEAFEHFDAAPTNIRYSWSAFSRDQSRLVCTLWQHYFKGKEYPLWATGDGAQSTGYSEHLRLLRRAIDNWIPIVGFIVVASNPAATDTTVRDAHIDRLFYLDVVIDTPDSIVGRIVRVDAT